MSMFRAVVSNDAAFYVQAITPELANAEAVNVCARLWLEYGLKLKVKKIEEVLHDNNRQSGSAHDVCVKGCAVAEDMAGAQARPVELGVVTR